MFTTSSLTKSYTDTHAVSDVSFEVETGERLAIIGPSGSGKTTLLHLLAGIKHPDSGSVQINGHSLHDLDPGAELSRLVGVMHQQFDLVDRLPVIHNVLAGKLGEWGFWKSLWSFFSPVNKPLAKDALERVGIADKLYEKTSNLSGGEQQRVALARLLTQSPRAILADEPVASVDPARADDLIQMLTTIACEETITLLVSLHTVDLALEHFPRIIGLRKGRILFDKSPDNVTDDDLTTLYEIENDSLNA